MTPLELQMLLHYHATYEPFPNENNAPQQAAITMFLEAGLLGYTEDGQSYLITKVGKAYLERVLNIPLPQKVYIFHDGKTLDAEEDGSY